MRSNAPLLTNLFYGLSVISLISSLVYVFIVGFEFGLIALLVGIFQSVILLAIGLGLHYLKELIELNNLQYVLLQKQGRSNSPKTPAVATTVKPENKNLNSIGLEPGYKIKVLDE